MAEIAILGAGMVGTATALALQEHGHDCLLIDRRAPGLETSYGNAGILQAEAMLPYGLPRNPLDLLKMSLGHRNALALGPRGLLPMLPALWSYYAASSAPRLKAIGPLWRELVAEAMTRHAKLADAAGAGHLMRPGGYWQVHETPRDLDIAHRMAEALAAAHGTGHEIVDGAGLRRAEPALRGTPAGAIRWTDPVSCRDPGALVAAYAGLFERGGGRIAVADAATLRRSGAGWHVAGEEVRSVVICLGPWSPALLERFGYRIPMIGKRGYHRHYDTSAILHRPMMLSDQSSVLSPMARGLRVATAVALPAGKAKPYSRQLDRAERSARRLLDLGAPVEATPWTGIRPCLPGMLPLVGEAPHHPGLWLNFGHGHQGFTLGPSTAWRLAAAMAGRKEAVSGMALP